MRERLQSRRCGLLAHPASVTPQLKHSLDALVATGIQITAAFGPQHGIRGDKQDNMVESDDGFDQRHRIPVFSLYGKVRRLTPAMLDHFDLLLVDLQDVGCRIYTYLTTLCYALEDCAAQGKTVYILDRPNPAGRVVDGTALQPGYESFVGAGPLPMRHGLTLGEAGRWYALKHALPAPEIVPLENYRPESGPGFGWPEGRRPWVNPSPNIATLNAARVYAGTVLLEGTTLSEGRGTSRPLEMFGAPDIDMMKILKRMRRFAPAWLTGCLLRPCWFEPTFHKHKGMLCQGLQIHTDWPGYLAQDFKPYRLMALFLKSLRHCYPDYDLWRDFPYEYTSGRLPIDTIDGGSRLREWVDDSAADTGDMAHWIEQDVRAWIEEKSALLVYPGQAGENFN